jgi:hypothetical protein
LPEMLRLAPPPPGLDIWPTLTLGWARPAPVGAHCYKRRSGVEGCDGPTQWGQHGAGAIIYAFEDYELDVPHYKLRCAGKHVKLEPQVFNVPVYLLQHRAILARQAPTWVVQRSCALLSRPQGLEYWDIVVRCLSTISFTRPFDL